MLESDPENQDLKTHNAAPSPRELPRPLRPTITSLPRGGLCGTFSAMPAVEVLANNTAAFDVSHKTPKAAEMTTAVTWLIVKLTPVVDAMSAGSTIFWKYVFMMIANVKNMWSKI